MILSLLGQMVESIKLNTKIQVTKKHVGVGVKKLSKKDMTNLFLYIRMFIQKIMKKPTVKNGAETVAVDVSGLSGVYYVFLYSWVYDYGGKYAKVSRVYGE